MLRGQVGEQGDAINFTSDDLGRVAAVMGCTAARRCSKAPVKGKGAWRRTSSDEPKGLDGVDRNSPGAVESNSNDTRLDSKKKRLISWLAASPTRQLEGSGRGLPGTHCNIVIFGENVTRRRIGKILLVFNDGGGFLNFGEAMAKLMKAGRASEEATTQGVDPGVEWGF